MRNVLLAAVSAVAILGSSPEANAIAAGPDSLALTAYDYDGHHFWYAPYGSYWVVANPVEIYGVPYWRTHEIDGKTVYLYGVSYDPAHAHYGLWHTPYANWAHYGYYVAPNMMDAALDKVVESPFNKVGTEVK